MTTTETEQGKRLSEHLIKQVTGNDQLTARFLYGEYFNFVPTFKIFIFKMLGPGGSSFLTNHKPVIKGTDHGIWRRIKLIPFTTTISGEKMDKYLEQKLLTEKSGILNWLIEGNFLKERCIQQPGASIRARELFRVYQQWCEENNELGTSERIFGLRLKELGIVQKRCSDGRYWQDLLIRS